MLRDCRIPEAEAYLALDISEPSEGVVGDFVDDRLVRPWQLHYPTIRTINRPPEKITLDRGVHTRMIQGSDASDMGS